MGGVEDDEPPSKRVKVSPGEAKSLSDGPSLSGSASSFLGHPMARPLCLEGGEEMVGSKQLIKKVEFVRIITKALYSLGLNRSGAVLEEESGIELHSSAVTLFRQHVLDGNWDESVATLHKIGRLDESTIKSAAFIILEQKFLELLGKDKIMEALKTLRNEITPISTNESRLHELSSCLVLPSRCKLLGVSSQDTLGGSDSRLKLLDKLQKVLPPSVMVPERRLEHLIEQALNVQSETCYYHNSLDGAMSLFTDHCCGKDQIPSKTLQVLQAHRDEVWFLQFSHNGKYLASSSNDGSTIIWEVNENGLSLKHTLVGHQKPVLAISWSPDDSQILTCGMEEVIKCWDVILGECLHVYEKAGIGMVSCGWYPDGRRIFSGLSDKSICMWDVEGKELKCWKGPRTLKISDMAVTSDGSWIISIYKETVISLLETDGKVERFIEENQTITSFSLSSDDKYVLVNLTNQEIHLWNIEGEPKFIAKYKGHKRTRFVIRSCFGGVRQAYIASGSEDSQVYIWHRGTGELLETLAGHSGAVNCVSWNPANPHMLASASDDRTIRIWGVNRVNLKRKEVEAYSNGDVNHCNGGTSKHD